MARPIGGIRRKGSGWQAYVQVRSGPVLTHTFPIDTPRQTMRDWCLHARVDFLRDHPQPARGTFAHDVESYLAQVRSMPTWKERKRELALWIQVFGTTRSRHRITRAEIATQLQTWLASGGPPDEHGHATPLAASTVKHRRTALVHFFRVMDGKSAPNPARDVPAPREPEPEPRGLPLPLVDMIIAAMPDRGRATVGEKRPEVSQSKARLRVLVETGIPHRQIMQLTPAHIDWQAPAVFVQPRRKGAGARGGWRPLTPRAVKALKAFAAADAWGPFSGSALRQSFRRACATVERESAQEGPRMSLAGLRPYDLRHSYATQAMLATRDLSAVKALLGHAKLATTERYTLAAVPTHLVIAAQQIAEYQARQLRRAGKRAGKQPDRAGKARSRTERRTRETANEDAANAKINRKRP